MNKQQIEAQDLQELVSWLNDLGGDSPEHHFVGGGWHHKDVFLSSLGWKRGDVETNGWDYDYWITYTKEGLLDILLSGCGHTGSSSISLAEVEDDE